MPNLYLISQDSRSIDKYRVEAETVQEAKEKVLNGEVELWESEFVEADPEPENMGVTLLEIR